MILGMSWNGIACSGAHSSSIITGGSVVRFDELSMIICTYSLAFARWYSKDSHTRPFDVHRVPFKKPTA